MEFLDEETRPRFLFHSRTSLPEEHQPSDRLLRSSLFISLSFSALLFSISVFSIQSEPSKSLLLWISLSLLLGPFAPSSLTVGNIRVGVGKLLAEVAFSEIEKNPVKKRSKNRRFEENPGAESAQFSEKVSSLGNSKKIEENPVRESAQLPKKKIEENPVRNSKGERDWSEGDLEMLKKLLIKNPVGKPKRWEAISEAFGGDHGVESVIKTAKSLGEKKMDDSDSFAKFLKDRKALDQRVEEEEEEREGKGRRWGGAGAMMWRF